MAITYRPDIDGLRAIAVLSVVIFHIDHQLLPGGFAGVDIFFVISGFLITGIISKGLADGSFSFSEFYRRRIKRIVPVLILVVAATLIAGNFILLPEDFTRLAKSAIASQIFAANIFFTYFLDTSYFAADAALEPLLHLWSLGVEEQFYLFWPVLLIGLVRAKGRYFCLVSTFILACASFIYAQWLLPQNPMFAYYMLPARAGQLLAGALCFLLVQNFPRGMCPKWLAELFVWAGISAIAFSLVFINEDLQFPGINALPVTLGTLLVIYSGSVHVTTLSRGLSFAPVVWVGLISYSMYLWHWPVLAYIRYIAGTNELELLFKLGSFATILLLSYVSYKLVETPFKKSRKSFSVVLVRQFILPVSFIIGLSCLVVLSKGYGTYFYNETYRNELSERSQGIQPGYRYPWICQSFTVTDSLINEPRCRINGHEEPSVLLWGDSNGSHYVGVLGEIAKKLDFSFRTIAHSSCPSILDSPERFVRDQLKQKCRESNRVVRQHLHKFDTVILSSDWNTPLRNYQGEFLDALSKTVRQLKLEGKRVILVGRVPIMPKFDRDCALKQLKLPVMDCASRLYASRRSAEKINKHIKRVAEKQDVPFFDITDLLCTAERCSGMLDANVVYHDPGHLSMRGSIVIGRLARENDDILLAFRDVISGVVKHQVSGLLPWDMPIAGRKILEDRESYPADELPIPDSTYLAESWRGNQPRVIPSGDSFKLEFLDTQENAYGAGSVNLLSPLSRQTPNDFSAQYLLLSMRLEGEGDASSLIRLRLDSNSDRSIDLVVAWGDETVIQRNVKAVIFAELQRLQHEYILQVLIPSSYLVDQMVLEILPSVSERGGGYSKKYKGRISIWDLYLSAIYDLS